MNAMQALLDFKRNLQHPAAPALAAGRPAAAATRSAAAADTGSGSSSGGNSTTITANDFLQLLVAEMKNQDPTADQDPNAYIDQLVQVNSLQQLISINQDLTPASSSGSGAAASGRSEKVQLGSAVGSPAGSVATALGPHRTLAHAAPGVPTEVATAAPPANPDAPAHESFLARVADFLLR